MLSRIRLRILAALLLLTRPPQQRSRASAHWSPRAPHPRRGRRLSRSDRGDVPGWVLITVMTAALVVGLWALAGDAFTSLFTDAINRVRQAG